VGYRRGLLLARLRDGSRGRPLLVAVTVMNASNYLFHVAVSRLLGPTAYGGLSALLAVMLVLSVPFGVLQATVARRIAVLRSEGVSVDLREVAAARCGSSRSRRWCSRRSPHSAR
jgi:hypothetical protein